MTQKPWYYSIDFSLTFQMALEDISFHSLLFYLHWVQLRGFKDCVCGRECYIDNDTKSMHDCEIVLPKTWFHSPVVKWLSISSWEEMTLGPFPIKLSPPFSSGGFYYSLPYYFLPSILFLDWFFSWSHFRFYPFFSISCWSGNLYYCTAFTVNYCRFSEGTGQSLLKNFSQEKTINKNPINFKVCQYKKTALKGWKHNICWMYTISGQ